MAVELQTQEKTLIAILSGEIDHHCAQPMRAEIDAKIDDLQPSVLVLDFAGVTFMDSSGIGIILGRYKKWKEQGGIIIVTGCSNPIRNILNMAGVFSLIEYMDTKKEALEYLQRKEVS